MASILARMPTDQLIERVLADAAASAKRGERETARAKLALALDLGEEVSTIRKRAADIEEQLLARSVGPILEGEIQLHGGVGGTVPAPFIERIQPKEPIARKDRNTRTVAEKVAVSERGGITSSRPEERSWDRTINRVPLPGAEEVLREAAARAGKKKKKKGGGGILFLLLLILIGVGLKVTPAGDIVWAQVAQLHLGGQSVDQVQAALITGDSAGARTMAAEVLQDTTLSPEDRFAVQVVLAATLVSSSPDSARALASAIVQGAKDPANDMAAARIFTRLRRPLDAATAYRTAFQRGAMGKAIVEIAHGLEVAGLTVEAQRVRQAGGGIP